METYEIDVEFLTEDLSQIHFTLHHDEYTTEHKIVPISFDPSADFHEYRFDWHPDSVVYYIDQERITSLTTRIPDDSTAAMINWWSNNNTHWGGSMPDTTTHLWVDYMAYVPLEDLGKTTIMQSAATLSVHRVLQRRGALEVRFAQSGAYDIALHSLDGRVLSLVRGLGQSVVMPCEALGTQPVVLRARCGEQYFTKCLHLR